MTRLLSPVFLVLMLAAAHAQESIPANDGWVTDLAGFLTASEERSLESLMESYKAGSTHEIALLTVPELGRSSIEKFALDVARAWKMGTAEKNNAALLVISRGDRKMRIEVGRGLEGNLTDSISGRIIRNLIAPEMKRGQYYAALRGGIEAMHAAAGGEYGEIPRASGRRGGRSRFVGLFPLLFFLMFFGRSSRRGRGRGMLLPMLLLGSMGSRRGGGFGGGGGGGGFGGFGGGGGFSGGGASGGW